MSRFIGDGIGRRDTTADSVYEIGATNTTSSERRRATRYVAATAADVADLALLLAALGLDPTEGQPTNTRHQPRKGDPCV